MAVHLGIRISNKLSSQCCQVIRDAGNTCLFVVVLEYAIICDGILASSLKCATPLRISSEAM